MNIMSRGTARIEGFIDNILYPDRIIKNLRVYGINNDVIVLSTFLILPCPKFMLLQNQLDQNVEYTESCNFNPYGLQWYIVACLYGERDRFKRQLCHNGCFEMFIGADAIDLDQRNL